MTDSDPLYCTFCGFDSGQRKLLIKGPAVHICDACLELCMDIEQQYPDVASVSGYINRDVVSFVLWLTYTGDVTDD